MRVVLCTIGAIFVGSTCFPLLPWYLLGAGQYLWKHYEDKAIQKKCFMVLNSMDPKVLRHLLKKGEQS